MVAAARVSGPLFGEGFQESVEDWLCAMTVAREAVSIQEVLNKTKPLVSVLMPVSKSVVENARTETRFRIFSIAFKLGSSEGSARADDADASPAQVPRRGLVRLRFRRA